MSNDDPTIELKRMLLWFKSQLPAHDVSEWRLSYQPHERLLEDTRLITESSRIGCGLIVGYGHCQRCRQKFEVPECANMAVWDPDDPEKLAQDVAKAKEWVLRDAERAGPCWGDVPSLPRDPPWPVGW